MVSEWKRRTLFASLEKIDLSRIYSLGEKYVGQEKRINLLASESFNDALVYGTITLKRYPNHHVRAYADKYDFDMHNSFNPLNWPRNISTIIGKKVAGKDKHIISIYMVVKLSTNITMDKIVRRHMRKGYCCIFAFIFCYSCSCSDYGDNLGDGYFFRFEAGDLKGYFM